MASVGGLGVWLLVLGGRLVEQGGPVMCPECASADVVGVEVRGVYDGVLYWVCRSCDLAFVRWPLGDRLGRLSEDYVALHNEARRG